MPMRGRLVYFGAKGLKVQSFESFVEQIKALPKGQLWRHNQSGDLIPSKTKRIHLQR